MTYAEFWRPLAVLYDTDEARAVARLVLEVKYDMSMADIVSGDLSHDAELQAIQRRLLTGEPVQYVLEKAEFGGRWFHVSPEVLIPRPETYELCWWIVSSRSELPGDGLLNILDIGTGSGCIACTLASELQGAAITAWDISDDALTIARHNAEQLKVNVTFDRQDALCPPDDHELWDIVVSNPPYIAESEKKQMAANVLDHEPYVALFVPDDDTLLFYRSIGRYATKSLKPGGRLFFETSEYRCQATAELLRKMGFRSVDTKRDSYDKERFVVAVK